MVTFIVHRLLEKSSTVILLAVLLLKFLCVLKARTAFVANTLPGPCLPATSRYLLMHPHTGCPVAPWSPAKLLLPHDAGADTTSKSITLGPLAAVILLVVVGAKLEAVVGATYQVSLAASVAVITTAISGPITVTLTLITGGLRSAASLAIVIPPSTSLTCRRLQG